MSRRFSQNVTSGRDTATKRTQTPLITKGFQRFERLIILSPFLGNGGCNIYSTADSYVKRLVSRILRILMRNHGCNNYNASRIPTHQGKQIEQK